MLIVAPVALNQPGNLRAAPFLIVNRLFAPETVKANFRKGEIESVWVVTIEWSRTSSPPAFTFSAYPWWDVSFAKLRPPSVSVRLPPEFTLIVPSTEYRIPVQTCVFVIVQSPVMTPPTWSQVPARAAGARARSVANSPPRATDQTMRSVRALALRPARLDIEASPQEEAPGYIVEDATGGHEPLPIQGRFLKRFSDDYPSRYVPVLTQENIGFLREVIFYPSSVIKIRFRSGMRAVRAIGLGPRRSRMDEMARNSIRGRRVPSIFVRVRWLASDREGRNPRVPRDSHAITGW